MIDLQKRVQLELCDVLEDILIHDDVFLCKHELNLLVAVHVCHDCNEVIVELLGDKLNTKSETLELPHKTVEDVGEQDHDHQWVCAAYPKSLHR